MHLMKTLGKKITYDQTPERLLINISGKVDKKYITLLAVWLALWTIAGIAVLSQIISQYTREDKLIMAVFLTFWVYFEYKIFHAYRWRQSGVEIIKIADGKLSYSREIAGKGKVQVFDVEHISKLKVVDYSDSPFQKAFYKDYWSLGGEMLAFTCYSREVRFGMQIEESEAKQLLKLLQKSLS